MTTELPIDDERLSAFLDGELSADERQEFEELLARETELQQAVAELRTMGAWVQALPRYSLGGDFADQVQRRLESTPITPANPASRSRRNLMVSGVVALAAGLLLVLLVPSFFKDVQVAQQAPRSADDRSEIAEARSVEPAEITTIKAEPETEGMIRSRSFRDARDAEAKQPQRQTIAGAPIISATKSSQTDTLGDDQRALANSADRRGNRARSAPSARMTPTGESVQMAAPAAPRLQAARQTPGPPAEASSAQLVRVRQRLTALGVNVVSTTWEDRLREQQWNDRFGGAAEVKRQTAATTRYPGEGQLILVEGSRQQLRDIARQLKQLDADLIIDELPEDAQDEEWAEPLRQLNQLREKSAAPTATLLGSVNEVNRGLKASVAEAAAPGDAARGDRDGAAAPAFASDADQDELAAVADLADDSESGLLARTRLLIFVPISADAPVAADAAKPE